MRGRLQAAVFLAFFGLYLWTSPPSLSPYRDAGEMSVAAFSLGVAHPPSYPLYVLLGHCAQLPGLGDPAYRLAALSAAAGALALAVLAGLLRRGPGLWPALGAAALLGTNATFWSVCQVQEMYSLTVLLAALLLALALRLREGTSARLGCAFAFLYGLSLGNRTDILLWAPGLLVLARPPRLPPLKALAAPAAMALLGLSVYLFLPLRSLRGPWLDWNHPASLSNFIGSLTRRGYGGTLDLLSKSYAPGAMFLPNLRELGLHLWRNFSLPGLALAALGLRRQAVQDRNKALGFLLLYAASGPLFLYLANLPPNPHAMAIVDPHYLLSDLVAAVWAAEGLAAFPANWAPALAALLVIQPAWLGRWAQMDRRFNLLDYDYSLDALRSAPLGAALVAKKDVQIFSLWYYQRVRGRRPDLRVVAQGLAHSPWYQDAQRRAGVALRLGPLRGPEDWRTFVAENGPTYATMDAELPPWGGEERGLLVELSTGPAPSPAVWDLLVRRGEYRHERRPDFFTSDLVDSTAAAAERFGARAAAAGKVEEARRFLLTAWGMKKVYPEALAFLGYLAFRSGDVAAGSGYYELAVKGYERTLALAGDYRALPDVAGALRRAAAEARLNLGAIYEKSSAPEKAERMYREALKDDPRSAKAHYNMAVLYWGKDWRRVKEELEAAASLDPGDPQVRQFLALARVRAP